MASEEKEKKIGRAILVVGPTGRGKSTSLRNMDPATSLIVNWERKALPFKDAKKFHDFRPKGMKDGFDLMEKYVLSDKLKCVVTDSFSAMSDVIAHEAGILKSGWDVWDYYNKQLFAFFSRLKAYSDNGKHVIVMGHDETLDDADGQRVRRMKAKGKQWEGMLEKEFDIVLWAEAKMDKDGNVQYSFLTQTDGKVPAKSPMGMFPLRIPNDMNEVIKMIEDYDK